MKKKLSLLLAIVLVISFAGSAFAFRDTASHWALPMITALTQRGILSGYEDGSFKPDANVTRAEFLNICYRFVNVKLPTFVYFSDIPSDAWYAEGMRQAKNMGIAPYVGTAAFPSNFATREEVSESLALLFGLKPGSHLPFSDSLEISRDYRTKVAAMVESGVIKGYPDGTFKPQKSVTRAELASMVYKLLMIKGAPVETYPSALKAVDKSKVRDLVIENGIPESLKIEARAMLDDLYVTQSEVNEMANRLQEAVNLLKMAKAEEKEDDFTPERPVYYERYIAGSDAFREELRILLNKVSDAVERMNHSSEAYKNNMSILGESRSIINSSQSSDNELYEVRRTLRELLNSISSSYPNFYLSTDRRVPLDERGKEIPLNASLNYSEEFLKSLVVLMNRDGEDLSERMTMRVEPEAKDLNTLKEFKVYYTDSETGAYTVLIFSKLDITPPVIQAPGTLDMKSGTELTMEMLIENGVNAYDTMDGDLTDAIEVELNGRKLPGTVYVGVNTLKLRVEDAKGNETIEKMQIIGYEDIAKSDLTAKFFTDDKGMEKYLQGSFGDDFEPVITLSSEELSNPLPNFGYVILKNTGEILYNMESGKWLVDVEWTLDGEKVSNLSNYKPGSVVKVVIVQGVETSSDPYRTFDGPIEIEVRVVLK